MTTKTAEQIGRRIGRAIARDVLAGVMSREWTGLDPQDGDQLTAAGIVPDSSDWDKACTAAHETYIEALEIAWWEWHDQDYSRASAEMDEAEARCAEWIAGTSDDGPTLRERS